MSAKRIAIIGSGISGLTAAYLLHKRYDITIYEANDYIGGHAHTLDVDEGCHQYAIDTGFMVFNEKTYENFSSIINLLGVEKQLSCMSFSFRSERTNLEYNGHNLRGLFSQKRNLINPVFYNFLLSIHRYNRDAKKFIQDGLQDMTLADFMAEYNYSQYFRDHYLYPLASAIWSMPIHEVGSMSAYFMIDFYNNHGLLDFRRRPKWYVIKGGSRVYVQSMMRPFSHRIITSEPVLGVKRSKQVVQVKTKKGVSEFDYVVLACHSNQALRLLDQATPEEKEILGNIRYTKNTAIVHRDSSALPRNKKAWASWNYLQHSNQKTSITYYINKLRSFKSAHPYCVSINNEHIDPERVIRTIEYEHPMYDLASIEAKSKHDVINNKNNTFYVGAYWGSGFHEDGVQSALSALASFGVCL